MSASAESFFTPLLQRDASGRGWLSSLLRAAPRGVERLGANVVETPGSLSMSLSVRGVSGRLAAFEYPQATPPELVAYLIEHPEELAWHEDEPMSEQTRRLRRALLEDVPPGSRQRAQERARELRGSRSVLSQEWWRFEPVTNHECLLMTDRLVLTIAGDPEDPLAPATPWFPARSRLLRDIEAAREVAGNRHWCCLLMSRAPIEIDESILGDEALRAAAPHLDATARRELRDAYLGNLTWEVASAAVAG